MGSSEDLAWAAGFFDAEGSACAFAQRAHFRTELSLTQAGDNGPPVELLQFAKVVDATACVYGPFRGRLFHWKTSDYVRIVSITERLWPYLGSEKREQVRDALTVGASRSTAKRAILGGVSLAAGRVEPTTVPDRTELAWAAGFFSGEGSVLLREDTARAGYMYANLSLVQASRDGGCPQNIARFQSALLGIGHVRGPIIPRNPWSRLPQFVWATARREHVQAALALMWPWLGARMSARARLALCTVNAQRRNGRRVTGSTRPGVSL